MNRWMLAASLTVLVTTPSSAEDLFWVVGNRATDRCVIVTSNPVVDGDIWFADGPYKTLADAKLARSTIRACPNKDDPADD
ncbi:MULTISPECIES: hypothetical protein [unclassified Bradyrhizobium]|uniref:hypothetical protein n=1 Tax=unclassified Bradyrhizobium TaxID=2631580 RepID=UPI0028EE03A0|nr:MULTISPECIES: hypothetical protein [unclassified Bradyrhizobium]